MKWISVKERLPENLGEYLIYPQTNFYTSFFNNGEFAISVLYGVKVTHWMPLPEAPEVEE
jgi:hypothetical protein